MRRLTISISVMRETSDLIEECGDGSSTYEAHCGGRGSWQGWRGTGAVSGK
jgi:hypothetical protein